MAFLDLAHDVHFLEARRRVGKDAVRWATVGIAESRPDVEAWETTQLDSISSVVIETCSIGA